MLSVAQAPTQTPSVQNAMSTPLLALVAIGICIFAVWVVRRTVQPEKLTLVNTPGRPYRIQPVAVLLILISLLVLLMAMQSLAARLMRMLYQQETSFYKVAFSLAWQVPMLAICLLAGAVTFRGGLVRGMGLSLRHWFCDTIRGLSGYFAVLPICMFLFWAATKLLPGEKPSHEMLQILSELHGWWLAAAIVSVTVMAPVFEEIFFRGMFQSALRWATGKPWIAIFATSAVFAFIHAPYWHTIPAIFALSVAMGYNYERCGRLPASILMHALFNAVNVWIYLTESPHGMS